MYGIVAQWVKLSLAKPASHIKILVRVLAIKLWIQLSADEPGKAAEDEPIS